MPTTVTSVISTTGSDHSTGLTVYTSWQAWEDACPASLTAVDQIWRGEGYNDGEFTNSGTNAVNIDGITSDATRYLEMTAAAGQGFADHASADSNAPTYNQSLGVGIRGTGTYSRALNGGTVVTRVSRLQLKGFAGINDGGSGAGNLIVSQNIINATGADAVVFSNRVLLKNNVCIHEAASGTAVVLRYGADSYGNTIVRPNNVSSTGTGITGNDSGCVVKNTAVFGFATASSGTFDTTNSKNNATDQASIVGASGNQVSKTYANQFVDPGAAKNFHVKSGSDLVNGIADATNSPVDLLGRTRAATPTIGALEFVSGSPAFANPFGLLGVGRAA